MLLNIFITGFVGVDFGEELGFQVSSSFNYESFYDFRVYIGLVGMCSGHFENPASLPDLRA